jgi:hypothetical protein
MEDNVRVNADAETGDAKSARTSPRAETRRHVR